MAAVAKSSEVTQAQLWWLARVEQLVYLWAVVLCPAVSNELAQALIWATGWQNAPVREKLQNATTTFFAQNPQGEHAQDIIATLEQAAHDSKSAEMKVYDQAIHRAVSSIQKWYQTLLFGTAKAKRFLYVAGTLLDPSADPLDPNTHWLATQIAYVALVRAFHLVNFDTMARCKRSLNSVFDSMFDSVDLMSSWFSSHPMASEPHWSNDLIVFLRRLPLQNTKRHTLAAMKTMIEYFKF